MKLQRGDSRDFASGNKLTFVELLQCVPLIEMLRVEGAYMEGYEKSDTAQISKNFPDIQDYSGFALDHLELFWMEYFASEDREVDFLKLIMAKSPMLKKAQIELCIGFSLEEENKMLRNLIRLPRASPSAKLIIKRPKPAS
ncbi:FBD domain, Leucine-rich repeat domain, L domain-like protein [Artemisia annua]|uniref:FBD domain, Leucine-rich repeat domain, L domain-like protein n=1 Tax=Artemisia annua TaxID=35608 RepID=A0A2U1MBH0_ARTAN|nr:FBD domain, Leucine-rich repeat domain, L domain-like protein [Artemisia annua]